MLLFLRPAHVVSDFYYLENIVREEIMKKAVLCKFHYVSSRRCEFLKLTRRTVVKMAHLLMSTQVGVARDELIILAPGCGISGCTH